MTVQAQAQVNAALRQGRPLPTDEGELKQEVTARIESGLDVNPQSPTGAGIHTLMQSVSEGRSMEQTVQVVAGTMAAAAGGICGPAAPVCGAVFATIATSLTKAIYGFAKGEIAIGAGKMSRVGRNELEQKERMLEQAHQQLGDPIGRARQQYLERIGQYITLQEVNQQFNAASRAAGIPRAIWAPTLSAYSPDQYEQMMRENVSHELALLMRVIATYAAIEAERDAELSALRAKQATQSGIKRVGTAAVAMQQDYGQTVHRWVDLLRAAGYSKARAGQIVQSDQDEREAYLKRAPIWVGLRLGLGATLLAGGVMAALWIPRWR